MALDIRALARASYDPRQFPGAYSDEKRRLRGLLGDASAASVADPRSVAAQNDPNDPRSIAHQQFPGLFGPPVVSQPAEPTPPLLTGVDDMFRQYDTTTTNGAGTARKRRFSYSSEI